MHLTNALREIVGLLNANGVEYVIIGGHALAWHGIPRYTGDIDFFVRTSLENARRIESAMHKFGFTPLTADPFTAENCIVTLGHPPNRIDIHTTIDGCSFDEAWAGKVAARLDGLPVHFIGKAEFIVNKRALGRKKDLADLEYIE